MSEHELWNELGNLYYLSGFNNQAVHAYNKAIQLESDYGKPYSNLALIYAKQAKYDQAIQLYKKSLDLLTDGMEKAITWNRLGNVYRQLKEYQEAVYAYHCADDLISKNNELHDQSNQMPYVSSESESLLYEVIDVQQDIQNHHTDFTLEVEPEFDDTHPELVPVEVEMLASITNYDQNTRKGLATEKIIESASALPAENTEMPAPIQPGSSFTPLESTDAEEVSRVGLKAGTFDMPEEEIFPEESRGEWVVLEPDRSTMTDASQEADVETVSEKLMSTIPDADNHAEVKVFEADFKSSEPIAQAEESVEALPDNFAGSTTLTEEDDILPTDRCMPIVTEAVVRPEEEAPETDSWFIKPIAQADEDVEALPEEFVQPIPEPNVLPDKSASEMESQFMEPIAPVKDGPFTDKERNSDPLSSFPAMEMTQETVNKNAQVSDKEFGVEVEEEKLAKQIEINPRSATTWEALGTLYKTAGRYEEAIQAFIQAISISPREVSYYHNLGLVYAAQGNNKDAFNTFQKILELDPNHSLTHASLGGYYKKMGLDELAQKHIGKAMKHIYESENEYNRACLDAICGNIDQAVNLLRIALENKQTYIEWVLNDPDLDSLRQDERFKQLIADFSK